MRSITGVWELTKGSEGFPEDLRANPGLGRLSSVLRVFPWVIRLLQESIGYTRDMRAPQGSEGSPGI